MPRHETGIARFLDEEAGIPAQDVRTQQILDRIEDFGVPDHLVDPGEEHMAAMAYLGLDGTAAAGFVILELAAKFGHLAGAQRIDWKMVAAIAVTGDLILAQQSGHDLPPTLFFLGSVWQSLIERDAALWLCQ